MIGEALVEDFEDGVVAEATSAAFESAERIWEWLPRMGLGYSWLFFIPVYVLWFALSFLETRKTNI